MPGIGGIAPKKSYEKRSMVEMHSLRLKRMFAFMETVSQSILSKHLSSTANTILRALPECLELKKVS